MKSSLARVVACLAVAACLPSCFPYIRTYAPALSGQVFDARTRHPVAGVRVYTRSGCRVAETRTARDGGFELPARTGLSLYFPGQTAFPLPRLVAESAAGNTRALTVDCEPTWLPVENAARDRAPSDGRLADRRGR